MFDYQLYGEAITLAILGECVTFFVEVYFLASLIEAVQKIRMFLAYDLRH